MHPGALFSAVLGLLLLGSCGQVITRNTPTPPPATVTPGVTQQATLRPTATPRPYTPAPTFTPTVTPTPIIYALKSGDTLLAIAGRYDISLRALEDANGITNPTGLMVGQELIIPREEAASAEGTPTATATALPFIVENVTFSRTPLDGLWCFGEIHNTTGVDLEQAAVRITLLGETGKPLAETTADAILDLIPSGGRAPFAARFAEPPVTFTSYTVYPQAGMRGYLGSYYRDLAVRDATGEGERYAAYTVSGNLANTGPEDAIDVTVTITLYDALGRVIATRRGPPEHNVIPRGGQTTFRLDLTPAGGPVTRFRVEALGRRLLLTPGAPDGAGPAATATPPAGG